jgi:hypothetical protein
MKEFILTINPTYNKRKNKGKIPRVTDTEVRETLLNELETDEFKIKCIDATLYKATNLNDQGFIGKANFNQSMENIYHKFSAFFTAYKSLAKKVICEGYGIDRNKNDFDDIHLLTYLGYGPHVRLISYDNRLKNMIKDSTQKNQVITIDELLHSE